MAVVLKGSDLESRPESWWEVLDLGKFKSTSVPGLSLSSRAMLRTLPSHHFFLPHISTVTSLGVILYATQI